MRMRFDEDARREYLDAMVFYSNRAEKIGAKFVDAVESAMAKIRSNPNGFRELGEGVRRCRVLRFPYSILYNVGKDEILILAIPVMLGLSSTYILGMKLTKSSL